MSGTSGVGLAENGWNLGSPARTFSVGIRAPSIAGGGHLDVAPGFLGCRLGKFTARVSGIDSVRHEGTTVDMFTARLVPPWFNVCVRVDDGERAVGASTWILGRRTLTRTLTACGFTVVEHHTWFFRGMRLQELMR